MTIRDGRAVARADGAGATGGSMASSSVVPFMLAVTGSATARDGESDSGRGAGGGVRARVDPSISNGTLRLGVNPQGHLDAIVDGGELLGLVYVPTGPKG